MRPVLYALSLTTPPLRSFMSACGLNSGGSCRWCVTPSAYVGMLVGLLSLSAAVVVYYKKTEIYQHLNDEGASWGLSANEIADIKAWCVRASAVQSGAARVTPPPL